MDGWGRVIAAVIDRRAELGWTQERLATEAGVGVRTVRNLENGRTRRIQAVVRVKIERALGWENGEFRRIESSNGDTPGIEPQDDWERAIVDDGALPDNEKRRMIMRSRTVRYELYPSGTSRPAAPDPNRQRGAAAS